MANLPPYPESNGDGDVGPDRESRAGTPRWAAVFGIAVAIGLVLLFVVLHLTGGIGPGAH